MEREADAWINSLLAELPLHPIGHVHRDEILVKLSCAFLNHYLAVAQLSMLDDALTYAGEALALRPLGHPHRNVALTTLSNALLHKFRMYGGVSFIDEALACEQEAVSLGNQDDQRYAEALTVLASILREPAIYHTNLTLVEKAVVSAQAAVDICKANHLPRDESLEALIFCLLEHSTQIGTRGDAVEQAVRAGYDALSIRPLNHPSRAYTLQALGQSLRKRYPTSHDINDLHESIALYREALNLLAESHLLRDLCLIRLAAALRSLAFASDLEGGSNRAFIESRQLCAQALSLQRPDHPRRPTSMLSVGITHYEGFLNSGRFDDLDQGIRLLQGCLELCPSYDRANRTNALSTVCSMLISRYTSLGDASSIYTADRLSKELVELQSDATRDWIHAACIRGRVLHELYHLSRDARLLEDAQDILEEAQRRCSKSDEYLPSVSSTHLANVLCDKYRLARHVETLDRAITLIEENVELSKAANAEDDMLQLIGALNLRLESTGDILQHKRIIHCCGNFYARFGVGHPDRHLCDAALSRSYLVMPSFSDNQLPTALECFFRMIEDSHANARSRLIQARELLPLLSWPSNGVEVDFSEETIRSSTLRAYRKAIELLTLAANFGLDFSSRLRELKNAQSIGLDGAVFAITHGEGHIGIEFLEESRAVLWTQSLHLRDTQFDRLPLEDAKALSNLFKQLARPAQERTSEYYDEDIAERRRQSEQVREILDNIRRMEGLEHFLQGQPFSSLAHAASAGPVVVLVVNEHACYALVLLNSRGEYRRIALPGVSSKRLDDFAAAAGELGLQPNIGVIRQADTRALRVIRRPKENSRTVLAELWATIVKPIIEALNLKASRFQHKYPISHSTTAKSCSEPVVGNDLAFIGVLPATLLLFRYTLRASTMDFNRIAVPTMWSHHTLLLSPRLFLLAQIGVQSPAIASVLSL
jgi:tetratricopeptide (TPR) repeat protein